MTKKLYKRLLLKISGESLMGSQKFGIAQEGCLRMATAIKGMHDEGFEVALVVGGGNIFRGVSLKELGMARTPADHMGMLSTLINGIALQQALLSIGCDAKIMSALECPKVADAYNWQRAVETLEKRSVLIFVGGTGNPYFTTDTAAALRASEIHADVFIKATKVDGIYNKDPLKHTDAIKYPQISYAQVLAEKLEVMDATSIALCMNNKIPVFVFNMQLLGTQPMAQLLAKNQGTLVHD
ncbi:MAG: UMP kinase [Parachlamydiaceae bacterium]|nr:UMP kinase [Parachlamydiaceae bacterium]